MWLLGLSACVPELDVDEAVVREPRVIAVQARPAEARPGEQVTYRVLYVDEDGRRESGDIRWFYCRAPKPLAELGPINRDCLDGSSGALERFGRGLQVRGSVPSDTCSLFGPNPPPPRADEPPGRPTDPDDTGGYKQPVMIGVNTDAGQDVLLFEQRIRCNLSGVPPQVSIEYNQRYHINENPRVSRIGVRRANGSVAEVAADDVLEVKRGEKVTLAVQWPLCPLSDECGDGVCGPDETSSSCAQDCNPFDGCGGQERYVWFNTETRALEVRRESLRVAWYGTGGTFEYERTGAGEEETRRESTNVWTAPDKAGDLTLWVVLRDARGGVGFREIAVTVR